MPQKLRQRRENIFNQHDRVEGDDLELSILLLQVKVAEYVYIGYEETQHNLVQRRQPFRLDTYKVNI